MSAKSIIIALKRSTTWTLATLHQALILHPKSSSPSYWLTRLLTSTQPEKKSNSHFIINHHCLCMHACVLQMGITRGTVLQIEALSERINNMTVSNSTLWSFYTGKKSKHTQRGRGKKVRYVMNVTVMHADFKSKTQLPKLELFCEKRRIPSTEIH